MPPTASSSLLSHHAPFSSLSTEIIYLLPLYLLPIFLPPSLPLPLFQPRNVVNHFPPSLPLPPCRCFLFSARLSLSLSMSLLSLFFFVFLILFGILHFPICPASDVCKYPSLLSPISSSPHPPFVPPSVPPFASSPSLSPFPSLPSGSLLVYLFPSIPPSGTSLPPPAHRIPSHLNINLQSSLFLPLCPSSSLLLFPPPPPPPPPSPPPLLSSLPPSPPPPLSPPAPPPILFFFPFPPPIFLFLSACLFSPSGRSVFISSIPSLLLPPSPVVRYPSVPSPTFPAFSSPLPPPATCYFLLSLSPLPLPPCPLLFPPFASCFSFLSPPFPFSPFSSLLVCRPVLSLSIYSSFCFPLLHPCPLSSHTFLHLYSPSPPSPSSSSSSYLPSPSPPPSPSFCGSFLLVDDFTLPFPFCKSPSSPFLVLHRPTTFPCSLHLLPPPLPLIIEQEIFHLASYRRAASLPLFLLISIQHSAFTIHQRRDRNTSLINLAHCFLSSCWCNCNWISNSFKYSCCSTHLSYGSW